MISALHIVGVSHRSVSAQALAHLIPDADGAEQLFGLLVRDGTPAVLLVTCNRMECVWLGDSTRLDRVFRAWVRARARALPSSIPENAIVSRVGEEAIRYLVRITAGLESQLRGDSDILGQVRRAWLSAKEAARSSPTLDRVFERTVNAARQIRQYAEFDDASRTIGHAAAAVLDERLGRRWGDQHVLVLGSGAAATSALDALHRFSARSLRVSSRTDARAAAVARKRCGVEAVAWGDRTAAIGSADVVVFALRAEVPVVLPEHVPALLKHRTRGATWADLGMPPNVHAAVDHPAIELLSLDTLMASRSLEDASQERAEAALARECARITATNLRRWDDVAAVRLGPTTV